MNVGKGSRQIGLVPSEDGLALRARGIKTPVTWFLGGAVGRKLYGLIRELSRWRASALVFHE
jgi:hypothetical protein